MASPAIPQPAIARATAPPRHIVHRDANSSAIRIEQWTVEAVKKPIMSIKEIEAAEKKLNLPLPEMTFGNNALTLSYIPGSSGGSSSSSSISQAPAQAEMEAGATVKLDAGVVTITFNAIDALAEVSTGEGWEEKVGGGVRVSMADKWCKQRAEPSLLTDVPLPSKPVKPHDWTYSSTHAGSIAGPSRFVPTSSPAHEIPIALLSRQDPVLDKILFYEDVPLFEDELHDNGESILNARIRVMPHSWFILARLFVRVDNVLFRMYDVRLYHAFGSGEIIRETSGMEADYDQVKAMLEKRTDLSPLTDANWVSRTMSTINSRLPPAERDSGCEKGREGGKAWPGLGKRIEVMRLPVTAESGEGLSRSMAGMGV